MTPVQEPTGELHEFTKEEFKIFFKPKPELSAFIPDWKEPKDVSEFNDIMWQGQQHTIQGSAVTTKSRKPFLNGSMKITSNMKGNELTMEDTMLM
jgi:hypothetical protein